MNGPDILTRKGLHITYIQKAYNITSSHGKDFSMIVFKSNNNTGASYDAVLY